MSKINQLVKIQSDLWIARIFNGLEVQSLDNLIAQPSICLMLVFYNEVEYEEIMFTNFEWNAWKSYTLKKTNRPTFQPIFTWMYDPQNCPKSLVLKVSFYLKGSVSIIDESV